MSQSATDDAAAAASQPWPAPKPPPMCRLELPAGAQGGDTIGYKPHPGAQRLSLFQLLERTCNYVTIERDPRLAANHDFGAVILPTPPAKTQDQILAGFPIVRPTFGAPFSSFPTLVFRVPAPPDGEAATLEEIPLSEIHLVEVDGKPMPAAFAPCARGCTYEVMCPTDRARGAGPRTRGARTRTHAPCLCPTVDRACGLGTYMLLDALRLLRPHAMLTCRWGPLLPSPPCRRFWCGAGDAPSQQRQV